MLKKDESKEDLREYYEIVKPILLHPEFLKRKEFLHHQDSIYEHCLKVSLCGFKIAKMLKPYLPELSVQDVAIAGLLHDFYSRPWREEKADTRFFHKHGFVHAYEASKNAYLYFPEYMDIYVEDAIVKHMFPLNRHLPKYTESWIITLADKMVSFKVLPSPKEIPLYLGFVKKQK